MTEAGFTNVHVVKQVLPIGTWPKDPKLVCCRYEWPFYIPTDMREKKIGAYNLTQLYEGLQGFTLRPFTKLLGWTSEEVESLLVDVRKDILNRNIHALFDWQVLSTLSILSC
jgi:hypothetical protein